MAALLLGEQLSDMPVISLCLWPITEWCHAFFKEGRYHTHTPSLLFLRSKLHFVVVVDNDDGEEEEEEEAATDWQAF